MSWEVGRYIQKHSYYLELPEKIHLPKNTEIDGKLIKLLLEKHLKNVDRYKLLQSYYEGWARIYMRAPKESYKPDNRLVTPYPSYIVDILLGMFLGKPVNYYYETPENENVQDAWNDLQATLDYNEESSKNYIHAKNMGIKGRSYELLYRNEDSYVRIANIDPENMMVIYDNTVEPEPLFALHIRLTNDLFTDKEHYLITVYTDTEYIVFEETENGFIEEDRGKHSFEEVPVVEILNNSEGIGDFERVLPLIDAMNKSQSDTANDFEEFTDALLVLYGLLNTESEDVEQLMRDRILLLDQVGGKQGAEWLIKEINDIALENYKDRLDDYIHKFSKVPNMSDESFAGNQSGVSQEWKMLALDQVIADKRTQMREALQRRLRLMITAKSLNESKMNELKYKDIAIVFQDNKPIDHKANVEEVEKLLGVVSTKTALSRLYFMEDVDKEVEAIQEEKSAYADAFDYAINNDVDDEEDDIDEEDS